MVDSLFAWQEWKNDGWRTIPGLVPGLGGAAPLVAQAFNVAAQLEPLARAHGRKSGNRVALRRFEFVEEV